MQNKRRHRIDYLRHQSELFCKLQKPGQIYDLLKISAQQYKNLTEKPQYQSFQMGKKSGGERTIEHPNPGLKKVQARLNRYLQAGYYFVKSPIAYGFILNSTQETDPRDILHNARYHLGQPYLINLDLKDFFHSIEVPQIWKVFLRNCLRLVFAGEKGETYSSIRVLMKSNFERIAALRAINLMKSGSKNASVFSFIAQRD